MTNKTESAIESPPPRGVGVECELRSFGTSIRAFFKEYLRINLVVNNAKKKIPAKLDININLLIAIIYYNTS